MTRTKTFPPSLSQRTDAVDRDPECEWDETRRAVRKAIRNGDYPAALRGLIDTLKT